MLLPNSYAWRQATSSQSHDISRYSRGDMDALAGKIEAEPRERLTRAEIIGMAVL